MKILPANSNDPVCRLELIINEIRNSEYPNDKSVMNDQLRPVLKEAYDINLNMLDTHHFIFGSYTGICEPDNFYIYEGNGGLKIFKEECDYGIYGYYPEGILLGFLDCRLRDEEFRKENIKTFFLQMFQIAMAYKNYIIIYHGRNSRTAGTAYYDYITSMTYIFAYRQVFKFYKDITIEEISEIGAINYPKFFFENKEKFMKVTDTFDYAKIYKEIIVPFYKYRDNNYNSIIANSWVDEIKKKTTSVEDDIEVTTEDNPNTEPSTVEDSNENTVKQIHFYMYDPFIDEGMEEAAVCFDYESTKCQIDIKADYIITTQLSFLSTKILKDGYKIYIHFKDGIVKEVKLGVNDWSPTPIKTSHNLEWLLYSGIIHKNV